MVARGKDLFHFPVKVKLSRMFNTEIESREVLKFVYNCRSPNAIYRMYSIFRGAKRCSPGFQMSYSPFTGVARNIVVISSTVKPFAH